jgi:hypothetical protein
LTANKKRTEGEADTSNSFFFTRWRGFAHELVVYDTVNMDRSFIVADHDQRAKFLTVSLVVRRKYCRCEITSLFFVVFSILDLHVATSLISMTVTMAMVLLFTHVIFIFINIRHSDVSKCSILANYSEANLITLLKIIISTNMIERITARKSVTSNRSASANAIFM